MTPRKRQCGELLAVLLLFLFPPAGRGQTLRLLNGDTMEAVVLELREGLLHLKSLQATSAPIRVQARYVGHTLHRPSSGPGPGRFRFTLRNGDALNGDVEGMDAEVLILKSTWGQTLHLRREALAAMRAVPALKQVLLSGGGDLSDWEVSTNIQQQSPPLSFVPEGVILQQGMELTRRLPPPAAPYALRFRVSSEAPFHMTFNLESAHTRREMTAMMRFILTGQTLQYMYHHPFDQGGMQRWAAQQDDTPANSGLEGDYTIYIHTERGEGLMMWNGNLVQRWSLPRLQRTQGSLGLTFALQQHNAPVRLEAVHLLDWDGIDPHDPEHLNKIPPPSFVLRNRDILRGKLDGWEDSHFLVSRPGDTTLRLLPTQIQSYQPDLSAYNGFRATRRDVRVRLAGGEVLTLALLSLDSEFLRGTGEAWIDTLQIPRSLIASIEWNIHSRLRWDLSPPISSF